MERQAFDAQLVIRRRGATATKCGRRRYWVPGYEHKTVSIGLIPLKYGQMEVSLTAHLCAELPSEFSNGNSLAGPTATAGWAAVGASVKGEE